MAVLQALQTAIGAARRNPLVFVIAAAFSLFQVPSVLAQSVHPLVGSVVSLGVSGLMIFVVPFFFGGIIGMANEAIDGRTSFETFVREGKTHYVSILVVYLGLFAINLVLGFVITFAAILGGIFFLGSAGQPSLVPLAILAIIGGIALLGYLLIAFVVQFFGHAVVVDDLEAVDSIKRSAWCVRHNLVAVFGYTVLASVGGAVFGVFGGVFSLLTSPQFSQGESVDTVGPAAGPLPVDLPSVGLAGTAVLVVLLVILTGLFAGLFATFSTAFYRTIRPVDEHTTEDGTEVSG
ncbi:DUF7847 domain-containing protein [Salinigranum halophilum]|uniref:DUF7847 domain-containing protein n=1 Tax=Salinigranum halophilum TaxID=2565931 RepID=UPI0010A8DECF|nr:hypothetical protein [Salinigranum halophilum]